MVGDSEMNEEKIIRVYLNYTLLRYMYQIVSAQVDKVTNTDLVEYKEHFEKTLDKLEKANLKTDSQVINMYKNFYKKSFSNIHKYDYLLEDKSISNGKKAINQICKEFYNEFTKVSDYNKELLKDTKLISSDNEILEAVSVSSNFLTTFIDTSIEKKDYDIDTVEDHISATFEYREIFEKIENEYISKYNKKSSEVKSEIKPDKTVNSEKKETKNTNINKSSNSNKNVKSTSYVTKKSHKSISFKKIFSIVLIPFIFIAKLFEKCFVGIKKIIVEISENIDLTSLLLSVLPTVLMITYVILSSKGVLNKIDFSSNTFHLTFFGYHFSAWNLVNAWLKAIDFTPFLIILLGIIILALLLVAIVVDLLIHAIMLVAGVILYLLLALLIFIWDYIVVFIIPVWLFILIFKSDDKKWLNVICFLISLVCCILYYIV